MTRAGTATQGLWTSAKEHLSKTLAHLHRKQRDFIRPNSREGKNGSFNKDQKKATPNKAMRTERSLSHREPGAGTKNRLLRLQLMHEDSRLSDSFGNLG